MTDTYFDESWLDKHYHGAPDECDIHWPTKLPCPEPECIKREAAAQREYNRQRMVEQSGDPNFDLNCHLCNINMHRCPGCGAELNHGVAVCSNCKDQ